MPVHPIEYRYFYPEMRNIFTEESKLQRWFDVEAALARAHAEVGNIPQEAAEEIERKAKVSYVSVEQVKEIERRIHHDVMSMVEALTAVCEGEAKKYIHLGATSYDIVDTALALQFRSALEILEGNLKEVLGVLLDLAEGHKETVCIGRTHGQHALPTTYGMKFALWASEVARHLQRLEEYRKRIVVGKMSGAVGTMASFGEEGFEIQRLTMEVLGLSPVPIASQVVQRDRHAEIQCLLALIAGTLDKIAKEIRNLQRTEIAEVFEPFARGRQVGSSTMPHKRNPEKFERICGLARVIRSLVHPALETIALEHERDLTNSQVERITLPEGFILIDYLLRQMNNLLKGLEFNYENIRRNLGMTLGLCLTERVMLELVNKGMGRQEAHERLRDLAQRSWRERRSLKSFLIEDDEVMDLATKEELDEWLDPKNYLGTAVEQVERVVKTLREVYP